MEELDSKALVGICVGQTLPLQAGLQGQVRTVSSRRSVPGAFSCCVHLCELCFCILTSASSEPADLRCTPWL